MKHLRKEILKELFRREKSGWWDLYGEKNPFATAGALHLLRKHGIWEPRWIKTARKLVELSPKLDLESLRMVLLLGSELKMNLGSIDKRLWELYDEERNLWRVYDNFSGDPLTSSAMLIALWLANHSHPLREKVLEGIIHNENLPEDLASSVGGQRPVLTALYRALALSLHGKREEARRIWDEVKQRKLVDLPPKYLLERGITRDEHYPALLAAVLASSLDEDPSPYLKKLENFDPRRWDNARLVVVGFYLHLLQELQGL